jgi:hypothetical protein
VANFVSSFVITNVITLVITNDITKIEGVDYQQDAIFAQPHRPKISRRFFVITKLPRPIYLIYNNISI